MNHPDLILASGSASRKAMLQAAGIEFRAVTPLVDEDGITETLSAKGAGPGEIAGALAERKALATSARVSGAFVIGADQVLVCEGRFFDKAENSAGARDILLALKGRKHQLISAVVLAQNESVLWRHVETADMSMRDFSSSFLDTYLAEEGDALLACVGCYRIEGRGAQLFASVAGDQFTVRGLPLLPLLDALRRLGALAA